MATAAYDPPSGPSRPSATKNRQSARAGGGVRNLGQTSRLRSLRVARARAMQEILLDGCTDMVSLARVHWHVAQQHPSAGDAELQHETVGTIGYLVRAGLVEVGYRGPRGHFVREPLEMAMQEVHDTYITRYDEPDEWIWCCWLNLTTAGQQLARSIKEGRRADTRRGAR
jgi:hypothetical protein